MEVISHILAGRHIGKLVISDQDNADINVPIRPAMRKFHSDSDVSYLIIGGLKGACGTMAIHMAQHGARHIVVSSRSGTSDDASAKVAENCLPYGCKVIEAKGDIANIEFVRHIFKNTIPRIAGINQEAMVLRVCISLHFAWVVHNVLTSAGQTT